VTLVRLAIWVATAFFVWMLFSPLVTEMMVRLAASNSSGMP
jgi:nitrate/nitrite transporter NarK